MSAASIRVQPLDSVWATLGAERFQGIVPEGIEASANPWGPDQLNFRLKIEPGVSRPELLPFTPVELELDGVLCWAGRVSERPSSAGEYAVRCEGWQYHLDDDLLDRLYVHQTLEDWHDLRDVPGVNLTTTPTAWSIEAGRGGLVMSVPQGATVNNSTAAVVYVDAGPDSVIKKITVTYESGNPTGLDLAVQAIDLPTSGISETITIDASPIAAGPATITSTFTTARRVARIRLLNNSGGAFNGTAGSWVKITSVIVYRESAYESGNASVLKADTVVADALALAPLLNASTALITAGSFSLPEYLTRGYATPRTIIEAVNAYENYQAKIGGHDLKTLVYRAQPADPLYEAGAWNLPDVADASVAGRDIYDKVIVEGANPDGRPFSVQRTQTGTLVDRRGFHRSTVVQVESGISASEANQLGDRWLEQHARAAYASQLSGNGAFLRNVLTGDAVPAHALLLAAGEKIRLADRADPDTGGQGRDGRIAGVTYRHDERALTIDIDDRNQSFELLLTRLAAR
jgi:hypothetical protein